MSDSLPTVAIALARLLRNAGVRHVFGVPGEDHLRLLDAFVEEGLEYVTAVSEGAAAFMAIAAAERNGGIGVATAGIAPGITNAMNGIASAYLDHVPLLVITGQHHSTRQPVIVRQGMDNRAIVHGVTKAAFTVSQHVHQVMATVMEVAKAAPAGPVFVELRDEVAQLPCLDSGEGWEEFGRAPRALSDEAVAALAERLARARRPAIVVGGIGYSEADRQALKSLAATFRAPVFSTPSAKGTVPRDVAFDAGTFLNGNLEAELLDQADLLVAVNVDARDFFNRAWPYSMPVVAIDRERSTQRFIPHAREHVADLETVVPVLVSTAGSAAIQSEWGEADVRRYRAGVRARFISDDGRLTMPNALELIRRRAPEDSVVAIDAGFAKPLTSYLWETNEPASFLSAHGLSTMGYAIPAANGAKVNEPGRTVIGMMGDGSLMMRASEMAAAVARGVAPIYVAWMDGLLTQIEVKQRRAGWETVGLALQPSSCEALAAAFGGEGYDVRSLADLDRAMTAALVANRPSLIGVHIDQGRRDEWFDLIRG
ncbi:MAG: thiamine pyrophosphate-binding protein [Chloroflexota bacterium]